MPRTGITQRDLARHLGLGQKTVSRALGAPGPVSDETRKRVEAAAAALGYRRNSSAASMRSGRFQRVILVQGMEPAVSSLPHEQLHGIHDRLAAEDYELALSRFDDQALSEDGFLPRTLRERSADGLLIKYDINVPRQLNEHIVRHRLPAVWINSKRATDAVHPDDEAAGRLAAEHLLALGHRRIAYLDLGYRGNPVFHYSREDRRQGCRARLAAAGLEPVEVLGGPHAAVVDAIRAYRITGVVCYGGGELQAAMLAGARLGLRVPEDLSVICAAGARLHIGIDASAVVADDRAVGEAAADLLLSKLDDPGAELSARVIPYQLIRGDTTAAAPAD